MINNTINGNYNTARSLFSDFAYAAICMMVDDVQFDAYDLNKGKMSVVLVEPGKYARVIDVPNDTEGLKSFIGSRVQVIHPVGHQDDGTVILCSEDVFWDGQLPNRALYDDDGRIVDIMFGLFIICNDRASGFESLDKDQKEKYLKKYLQPEMFRHTSSGILDAVKYDPDTFFGRKSRSAS